ncbi:MAG: sensor histidine kinase [Phycicoccus sp.]
MILVMLMAMARTLSSPVGATWVHMVTVIGVVYGLTGMVAVTRQPANCVGLLMVLAGLGFYAEDISWVMSLPWESGVSPIARQLGPLLRQASVPFLVHLAVVYPAGKLSSRRVGLSIVALYCWCFGVSLVWTSCASDFWDGLERMFWMTGSGGVCAAGPVLERVGSGVITALVLAYFVSRLRCSTEAERIVYAPVVAGFFVAAGGSLAAALLGSGSDWYRLALTVYLIGLLVMPCRFLFQVVRVTDGVGVVAHVSRELSISRSPAEVQSLLRRSLGDDRLIVGVWNADTREYEAVTGGLLRVADGQSLHTTTENGTKLAIVRDSNRWSNPRVADTTVRLALAELRSAHAAEDVRAQLRRDLHDSAQQSLIAIALRLKTAEERAAMGDSPTPTELATLRDGVESSLRQVRRISHGLPVAPACITGLTTALEGMAAASPCDVRLSVAVTSTPAIAQVQCAYWVVTEAMANVLRHGRATRVEVQLSDLADDVRLDGSSATWTVTVGDNGVGFGEHSATSSWLQPGTGLGELARRVREHGGSFMVGCSTMGGAVVRADLPVSEPRTGASRAIAESDTAPD